MTTPITREKIAEWAKQIARLAGLLAPQIRTKVTDLKDLESVFFYAKLIRHSMIMNDVSTLVKSNSDQKLAPVFILLRCMLEDFITIFYLKVNSYRSELITQYFAEDFANRFKWMKTTARINDKFFNGSYDGLPTNEYVENKKTTFIQNKEHNHLFTNRSEFKFKTFPSTTEIINELPVNDSTVANAVSLIDWIHYSEYVHHSMLSARSDIDQKVREIEIKQLKGVMFYGYKLVEFTRSRLEERQFDVKLDFDEKLVRELTENTIDVTKLRKSK